MTGRIDAKEKAVILLNKYLELGVWTDYTKHKEAAKQCALIAVDLVISELDEIEKLETGILNRCWGQDTWLNVKTELEKL